MDYGHELVFGTFLTPAADAPDRVIALARLTEQAGLDLVSFQDHPYQPRLMDAWTLLSVVAAQTQRVKVSTNVANLPLRHPVVLARSVATLDRITGGRVELGLGSGGFLDAVAANGGPRLTTGQSITALEEAIAIIREVWTPGGGGIRLAGKHYELAGAKRGPEPAHDVSIWLGAYKPRMLAVTGRLADGWLPSSGYAGPEQLAAMNKIIDEAAVEAGRDPAAVRRLYNIGGRFDGSGFLQGPVESWIDQLTELTLAEGVSTYILASDDPDDIRRFADVAAGVREAVQAARSGAVVASVAAPVPAGGFSVVPTPAPVVRRSSVQVLDEASRPTGPAAEPRTYTAHQLQSGQHLVDVHDHLRAELEQVRDLVEQVAAGTLGVGAARSHINTMTMRQNNWTLGTYCESYCRLVTTHHSIEDASLFPHLRRADPALAPVVDRLQEEHKVIHDVLEGVDKALVDLVGGSGDLAGLRAAVDLLDDTLQSHLSYEERELVEPLARLGVF
ncbi:LLM class flavin-dependent oxidoreductase [Kribbella solani]|uniref:Alkanesulfonate monooxygenase SsuD/methylene tetrahydromethanopterin reductase-like flavin-dependent oxidoreductase (Luciferase family) n=1 Tax=Kribbella solani TaxID=236067 RepID=A0A841DP07_9ACTN|nr:LLM class flavin-dependent oxidoreductase [Kribbella solani]MBB5977198.1 alkanesulfonate monooxygenase SsuD/methylene tetrahydromethanopterin reductase-like flavin-dependent oxidoreductase (luciferase family) [Kribbella solani]